MSQTKKWLVEYSHDDGRSGTIEVTTEIGESGAFQYGNGKCGALSVDGWVESFDLRYCTEADLHKAMLETYFGDGLVEAKEI